MLLKLSIYFCSLLHFFSPHSTQHLGIQICCQRNEKHDKVAAIKQHAVPPLDPLSPRRHHELVTFPPPSSPSGHHSCPPPPSPPPQRTFTHSTTSQYTTGFRAKPAVCSGGCMTDCVAAAELESPQDGASRTRLTPRSKRPAHAQ